MTPKQVKNMLTRLERADAVTSLGLVRRLDPVEPVRFAPQFREALHSPSGLVRQLACKKLRYANDLEVARPLTEVLENDPDESVRRSAAAALGGFSSPAVVAALLKAARSDPAPEVRRFAMFSLRELKVIEAALPLAERLGVDGTIGEKEPGVVQAILDVIGELADPRVVPILARYYDRTEDPGALAPLGKIGSEEAARFLQGILQQKRPRFIQEQIATSLLRLENGRYDAFLVQQAQTNREPAVRAAVYRAAQEAELPPERRRPFATAAGASLAQDQAPEVREAAAGLLK